MNRDMAPFSQELLLGGLVRDWVAVRLPGDIAAADRAVGVAMRTHAGGASVSEAYRAARAFVESWARHPSHQPLAITEPLRHAS